ncbi:hypothetical protein L6164_037308 [Bauhinia variegata]|uniref:Uncharacterized protein n=1 Tax=Bauhinia variegata TaxID=167791 RepID=A0ACB9KJU1_BAUVA|nr:hypothetical protein L6164_037308 [Bauhinia variegata]
MERDSLLTTIVSWSTDGRREAYKLVHQLVSAINGAAAQFPMPPQGMQPSVEAFENGINGAVVGVAAPGRGKRRVMEEPVDKFQLLA